MRFLAVDGVNAVISTELAVVGELQLSYLLKIAQPAQFAAVRLGICCSQVGFAAFRLVVCCS